MSGLILQKWRDLAIANRSKRNQRMLVKICAIDSLYRCGLRQLVLNVSRSFFSRKRSAFRRWKSLFNETINERVLFHRVRLQRRARCFQIWLATWYQIYSESRQILFACDHHSAVLLAKSVSCWKKEVENSRKFRIKPIFNFMNVHMRHNILVRKYFFQIWIENRQKRVQDEICSTGRNLAGKLSIRIKRKIIAAMLHAILEGSRRNLGAQNFFFRKFFKAIFNQWSTYSVSKKQRRNLMAQVQTSALNSMAASKLGRIFTTLVMFHLAQVWRKKSLQARCLHHLELYSKRKQGNQRVKAYATMYFSNLLLKRYFRLIKCALTIKANRSTFIAHTNMQEELLLKRRTMLSWFDALQEAKTATQGG